jgi:hypothetical protein
MATMPMSFRSIGSAVQDASFHEEERDKLATIADGGMI